MQIINLFTPLALLISMSVLYTNGSSLKKEWMGEHPLVNGLVIGLFGILLMFTPFLLSTDGGKMYDFRIVLLFSFTAFYGWKPVLISLVMLTTTRILLGGNGCVMGVVENVLSFSAGVFWHEKWFKTIKSDSRFPFKTIPVFAFLTYGVALCIGAFFPWADVRQSVVWVICAYLVLYPLASWILVKLLFEQSQRRQTAMALAVSRERFASLFENAPVGMSLSDPGSGRPSMINTAYQKILLHNLEEIQELGWQKLTYPDDLKDENQVFSRFARGEKGPMHIEKRMVRGDGMIIWVDQTLTSIMGEEKSDILCICTDITQKKEEGLRVEYASTHNHLTGLFNRESFEETVRKLVITKVDIPYSVVVGNLHSVSLINGTFGRSVADEQIRRFADVCAECLPAGGYLAHTGGDEIGMLLPRTDTKAAEALTDVIQGKLSQYKVQGTLMLTASFGIATTSDVVENANQLVSKAEDDLEARKIYDNNEQKGNVVTAIVNSLHAKNPREEQHSQRVGTESAALAQAVGLTQRQVDQMRVAGLLHDIGKIGIDESILNKPGLLLPSERAIIQKHTEIGYRILSSSVETAPLAPWVLSHHERYDGKGYPKGLKGENIPLCSRILTVADTWDAMVCDRPYRKALSVEDAVKELCKVSGTQLDPKLTRVFVTKVLHRTWIEQETT